MKNYTDFVKVFMLGAIFWNKVKDQLDRQSTEVQQQ
jgi:hypothetical protein